jgi:cell division protease FtsH
MDDEVKRIVRGTHEEATRLLDAHRDELEALVHALMERETLDEEDILEVTGLARPPAHDGSVARSDGRAG